MGRIVFGMKWGEWVGGRKAGECRQCSVCFCQDWCRGSLDWRPWGGRAMVMMWEICRHFSDSDVKIDGRVLEGGSLGMSVSSTPPSWLTGGAIRGGSRHLTRVACEKSMSSLSMWLRLLILTMDWVTVVTVFSLLVVFQTFQAESTTC